MPWLRNKPWIVWLFVAPVLVWTVFEDIQRDASVHIVAVGVLVLALAQPELSERRPRLEYLAFALFQISMAIAVRGIVADGGSRAIAVVGFWGLATAVVIFGYRRHQRRLRANAQADRASFSDARS